MMAAECAKERPWFWCFCSLQIGAGSAPLLPGPMGATERPENKSGEKHCGPCRTHIDAIDSILTFLAIDAVAILAFVMMTSLHL